VDDGRPQASGLSQKSGRSGLNCQRSPSLPRSGLVQPLFPSVLFELIATRYERRSLLITANQPFGEWGKIFSDQAMTLATIDRLVHHATILEMNVESYRRKAALKRKRGPGD
jgi:hypothetical protein